MFDATQTNIGSTTQAVVKHGIYRVLHTACNYHGIMEHGDLHNDLLVTLGFIETFATLHIVW
jgi:hypothetical protein